MVRKMAYIGSSYLVGLFFASFLTVWVSVTAAAALCAGAAAVLILAKKDKKPDPKAVRLIVCAFSCSAGIFLYTGYDALVYRPLTAYDGTETVINAVVKDAEYSSDGKTLYTVRTKLGGRNAGICFYADDKALCRGDRLTVSGKMYIPSDYPDFDARSYYKSKGIFLMMRNAEITEFSHENGIYSVMERFRTAVSERIHTLIPTEEGSLMSGMLFGSRYSGLSDETLFLFRRSGISHITAVSGLHIAAAAAAASAAAVMISGSVYASLPAVIAVTVLFVLMNGFSPSVVRSAVMLILVYTGGAFGRRADSLNSLGTAVILLTVTAPYAVRDVSFLLSVSGALGTGVLAPKLYDEYLKYREKLYPELFTGVPVQNGMMYPILTCFCAAAATFPAAVMSFDSVSVISPLSNLILSPFYTAALVISLAAAVLYPVKFLSEGLIFASGVLLKPVVYIAEILGSLNSSALPLGLPPVKACAMIAFVFITGVMLLTGKTKYTAYAFSAAAVVFSLVISVYRLVPSAGISFTLLAAEDSCAVVFYDESSAEIIDLGGKKNCAELVGRFAEANGTARIKLVVLTDKDGYIRSVYDSFAPEAQFASFENSGNGGRSFADGDTLTFADSRISVKTVKENDCVKITAERDGETIRILCVDSPDADDGGFGDTADMIIYTSGGESGIHGKEGCIYAVTNDKNRVRFLPSDEVRICTSADYRMMNGKLTVKD